MTGPTGPTGPTEPTEPTEPPTADAHRADLVLEGGGVKGIALSGAVAGLVEAGYTFPRIAGTSAGAICGSVAAAMQAHGEPLDRLVDVVRSLDLSKVPDSGRLGRLLGPAHHLADGLSMLLSGGLYEGEYLLAWLRSTLSDFGVRTFGDLRRSDTSGLGGADDAFVAVVSDLSAHRMSLLPWDFDFYRLDRDEQSVAEAVRASASIPLVFEPWQLSGPRGSATLVDGGLLSNYPITAFDTEPGVEPRWPTFGIRLSAREDARTASLRPVRTGVGVAVTTVETALTGWDARHIDDPETVARTIFVDTGDASALDFDLSESAIDDLVAAGREAAARFLARRDHPGDPANRGGPPHPAG